MDDESINTEQDIYDEENLILQESVNSMEDNLEKDAVQLESIQNSLVAQVGAVTGNEALSPRLVAVNATDDSLTWMLGRLDHTVAAEKYQVLFFLVIIKLT